MGRQGPGPQHSIPAAVDPWVVPELGHAVRANNIPAFVAVFVAPVRFNLNPLLRRELSVHLDICFFDDLVPGGGRPPSSCPFRVDRDPAVADSAHPVKLPLGAGNQRMRVCGRGWCFLLLLPASCRRRGHAGPHLPFFSTVSLENNLEGRLLTGLANMVMLEGPGGATVIQGVLRQRGHGRHVMDNGIVVPCRSRRVSSRLVKTRQVSLGLRPGIWQQ